MGISTNCADKSNRNNGEIYELKNQIETQMARLINSHADENTVMIHLTELLRQVKEQIQQFSIESTG